ncbi:MAG: hypothetical protein LYZ70_04800 [Nitrososphaerales archaeon]|nr:hypothetical protein [Nitrososphaerales archaeon]
MKQAAVETYHLSKTFKAPLRFVFAWCTDYREDDPKMLGSKNRRMILVRNRKIIAWWVKTKNPGSKFDPIRVVWLRPPNSWHLDTCGDGSEIGDYKLKALPGGRTKLDMTFKVTYENPRDVESRKEWEADGQAHWDSYGKFLERDYQRSLR